MISITEAQLLGWLASFLLPFFRILGIFTAAPILSARAFPARVRIGLALLVAVVTAPLEQRAAGILRRPRHLAAARLGADGRAGDRAGGADDPVGGRSRRRDHRPADGPVLRRLLRPRLRQQQQRGGPPARHPVACRVRRRRRPRAADRGHGAEHRDRPGRRGRQRAFSAASTSAASPPPSSNWAS